MNRTVHKEIGVFTQDIEEFFPELIFTDPSTGMKGVYYDRLSVILLQGIREQQNLLSQQSDAIKEINSEMKVFRAMIFENASTN